MKHIKAFFFDFGGTLFDFFPSNQDIWIQIASEFGKMYSIDDSQLLRALAKQADAFDQKMMSKTVDSTKQLSESEWRELDEILLSNLGINDPQAIITAQQAFSLREGNYKIFPDTKDTLRELRNLGKKICLISNSTTQGAKNRRPILEKEGILDFFDTIILSSEVAVSKPSSGIFQIALKELEIKNVHEVCHIGDFYYADVIGARNAGITPILYDTTGFREVDCLRIKSLSEIFTLITANELDN